MSTSSFAPPRFRLFQVAESPSQIAVADLNGDKRPDIVISSGNASGMLVPLINEYGVVANDDEPEFLGLKNTIPLAPEYAPGGGGCDLNDVI